jgi:uncharacterized protein (TIGR02594 family)
VKKIETTAFAFAEKFIGIREIPGNLDHPLIQWALALCFDGNLHLHDEVPNCSAWLNLIAWNLGLPRSNSAAARSWLLMGEPITLDHAEAANDVVVLTRGKGVQPGPEVIRAQGHCALFGGYDHAQRRVLCRGGNQGNAFSDVFFSADRILGLRRLL